MFKNHYQGGTHVEIFSAQGKDPAAKWKQAGKVQRIFDKDIKSYIYNLEGGPATKMQLPRDEKQQLSLSQPFLVLQLSVPLGVSFSIQLIVIDTLSNKRRIFISTAHKQISHTPLHAKVPLGMLSRGSWINLALNIGSLVTGIFHATFRTTQLLSISATCKLRKIFTMRHQPHNTHTGLYSPTYYNGPTETIPKACSLSIGTVTQVIDISVINQWLENQQQKAQREGYSKSAPQMLRSKTTTGRNAHSAELRRHPINNMNKSVSNVQSKSLEVEIKPKQSRLKPKLTPTTVKLTDSSNKNPLDNRIPTPEEPTDHSTPNPLMDRVLDLSFSSSLGNSRVNNENQKINNDKELMNKITNGNLSFRSTSTALSNNPSTSSHKDGMSATRAPSEPDDAHISSFNKSPPFGISTHRVHSQGGSSTTPGTEAAFSSSASPVGGEPPPHSSTSPSAAAVFRGRTKVYNSKDYTDNPFAGSDEDLKYRLKALAMYNGELEDSLDFSAAAAPRTRMSQGVGPGAADEEEIEEKLGEDSDTSSSDGTVLSHAHQLLQSDTGNTSFLHESLNNRVTERAYSPPICYPDELTRQATLAANTTLPQPDIDEVDCYDSGEEEIDLLYDPVLNCYFDPKTCKYYELA